MKTISWWNTPRILTTASIFILALNLVLIYQIYSISSMQRNILHSLSSNALPAVENAHHIKGAVADMDATVAERFMKGDNRGPSNDRALARQSETIKHIIAAAASAGDEKGDRELITNLALNFNNYSGLVLKANTLEEAKDLLESSAIMHERIFPEADSLIEVNRNRLMNEFDKSNTSMHRFVLITVLSCAEVAILIYLQLFLTRKTRRLINLPLALATLLLGTAAIANIFIGTRTSARMQESREYFISIDNLWAARATYYDINGDIIRGELRHDGEAFKKSVLDKARLIVQAEPADYDALSNSILQAAPDTETEGYFITAVRAGDLELERKLVAAALRSLKDVLKREPEVSIEAFKSLDQLVGKAIFINQEKMEKTTKKSGELLDFIEYGGVILAVFATLLSLGGIQMRKSEYA